MGVSLKKQIRIIKKNDIPNNEKLYPRLGEPTQIPSCLATPLNFIQVPSIIFSPNFFFLLQNKTNKYKGGYKL